MNANRSQGKRVLGRILREALAAILVLALLAPGLGAKERKGALLAVRKTDGTVFEGELLAVRGINLIMINEVGSVDFEASLKEVETVTIIRKSKFALGLGVGILAGGVSGAALGALAIKRGSDGGIGPSNSWFRTFFVGCGAALGGLVGGLIGAGAGKNEVLTIVSTDSISIGRAVAQLRRLARDRS
jgi:hypothetical protein